MYVEILCASILGIALSWWKFRDILHPHFVLTIILFSIFCSDFLVRGYEDKNLDFIEINDIKFYQFIILLVITLIYSLTFLMSTSFIKVKSNHIKILTLFATNVKQYTNAIPLFAWGIFCLEILKRLYFSSWSITNMFMYSFGPRAGRPWASAAGTIGDNKFLFALLGILFPLAGLILSLDAISSPNKARKSVSFLGYILALTLIVGAGSRTPLVLLVIFPLVFYLRTSKSSFRRFTATALAVVILVSATSFIYNNRDSGFISPKSNNTSIVYHQDDSYYRAIYAFNIAAKTSNRWEIAPFFGASFLNFIPRVVWPNKPTLTKDYWGDYKLHYVTITFLGELAALFGVWEGATISIFIGLICFLFLVNLYKDIFNSYNLLLYILGSLYVYMIFRSMLNITQFIYMFLFFFLILKLDQKIMRLNPKNHNKKYREF